MSLVQLIVERGVDAVTALPEGIRKNKEAVAEATKTEHLLPRAETRALYSHNPYRIESAAL